MRERTLEIVIGVLVATAGLLSIGYFWNSMRKEQTKVQTDLYSLIAPNANGLLSVNRPQLLYHMLEANSAIKQSFATYVPPLYQVLIFKSSLPSLLLSFHPEGVLIYAKANKEQIDYLETKLLLPLMGGYAPIKRQVKGINYTFFAEKGNRYFGYYRTESEWVGSYNRLLLEASAQCLSHPTNNQPQLMELRKKADKNAMMNLFLPTAPFNLYTNLSGDSTIWRMDKILWAGSDLFVNNKKLCCFSLWPERMPTDSLYQPMADTLTLRIGTFLPGMVVSGGLNSENGQAYYTACIPIQ
ncbi:MAG: hypothetical protein RRZ65_09765 [Tannerellaceae bacterium]